ncbi:hypothetical protein VXS06_14740 [Photobacterium toruni]|uniref:Uncharacterized protein n=1 Tax=Photobacterium toruni TaxID=1935446 RepID=A0ABU6L900_9GAMM|nr:hypothetical protein [Photobacterium toruni]
MSASSKKNNLTEAERQDLIREKSRKRQTAYRQRKQAEHGVKPVLVRITERAHKKLFLVKEAYGYQNLSVAAIHCIEKHSNLSLELAPLQRTDPQGSRQQPLYLTVEHKIKIDTTGCWWRLSAMIEHECATSNLE